MLGAVSLPNAVMVGVVPLINAVMMNVAMLNPIMPSDLMLICHYTDYRYGVSLCRMPLCSVSLCLMVLCRVSIK
jgi:hypothetical protein